MKFLIILSFFINFSELYRIPNEDLSSNEIILSHTSPNRANDISILIKINHFFENNTIIQINFPEEYNYKIFSQSSLMYYLPNQRYSFEIIDTTNKKFINYKIDILNDRFISLILLDKLFPKQTEFIEIKIFDKVGIDTVHSYPFQIFIHNSTYLISYNTHLSTIEISDNNRGLIGLNFLNDILNTSNYAFKHFNLFGIKLIDLNFTLFNSINKKSNNYVNAPFDYMINTENLELVIFFNNFFFDFSFFENFTTQIQVILTNQNREININNPNFYQNYDKHALRISLEYKNQYGFESFDSAIIKISNIMIFIDQKINSNQKYIFNDEYEYQKSIINMSLIYTDSNFIIETTEKIIQKTKFDLINAINNYNDDYFSNFHDFKANFFKNNLNSQFNKFNLKGKIILQRNWNILTVKFESIFSSQDKLNLGESNLDGKENYFIKINNSFIKSISKYDNEEINDICINLNINSKLTDYKSIQCEFNIINTDLNDSMKENFNDYDCVFCEYKNDQQINIILKNTLDSELFLNNTFIEFDLNIPGLYFITNDIIIQYLNSMQLTYLISYMFLDTNIKKNRDYDFSLRKMILNKVDYKNKFINIKFLVNNSCFLPQQICDYTIIFTVKGEKNIPGDVIELYFNEIFPIDSFELINIDFGKFVIERKKKYISINLINTESYSWYNNKEYSIKFFNKNPKFSNPNKLIIIILSTPNFIISEAILNFTDIRNYYKLNNILYTIDIKESTLLSDHIFQFNYDCEIETNKLIIEFEGDYNIIYYTNNLDLINIDIFIDDRKIDFNLLQINSSYNYILKFEIFFVGNNFTKGNYKLIFQNMKNPLPKKNLKTIIKLFNSYDKIIEQTFLFNNNEITSNINIKKQKNELYIKELIEYNDIVEYLFIMNVKIVKNMTLKFKLHLPLEPEYQIYRSKANSQNVYITIIFPNNSKIISKSDYYITFYSKIIFYIDYNPLFNDVELIHFQINIIKPQNTYKHYFFLLYIIKDSESKINQIIEYKYKDNQMINSLTKCNIDISIKESMKTSNYFIYCVFPFSIIDNHFIWYISIDKKFRNINLKNLRIWLFNMKLDIPEFIINDFIYFKSNNTLKLETAIDFNIKINDYSMLLENIINPYLLESQSFCFYFTIFNKEYTILSDCPSFCSNTILAYENKSKFTYLKIENYDSNYEFITNYKFELKGNFILIEESVFVIEFPSNEFLNEIENQVKCELKTKHIVINSKLNCIKISNTKISINNIIYEYLITKDEWKIEIILHKITNPKKINNDIDEIIIYHQIDSFFEQNISFPLIKLIFTNKSIIINEDLNRFPMNTGSISDYTILLDFNHYLVGTNSTKFIFEVEFDLISNLFFKFASGDNLMCLIRIIEDTENLINIPCMYNLEQGRIQLFNLPLNLFTSKNLLILKNMITPFSKLEKTAYFRFILKSQSQIILLKKFPVDFSIYNPIYFIDIISIYQNFSNYNKINYINTSIVFSLSLPWCSICQENLFIELPPQFIINNDMILCDLKGVDLDFTLSNNYLKCFKSDFNIGKNIIQIKGKFRTFFGKNFAVLHIKNIIIKNWVKKFKYKLFVVDNNNFYKQKSSIKLTRANFMEDFVGKEENNELAKKKINYNFIIFLYILIIFIFK